MCGGGLYVEAEQHDVAVLDDILLAFGAHLARVPRALFAAGTTAMEIDGPWQVPFVGKVNPDMVSAIKATRSARVRPGTPSVIASVWPPVLLQLTWLTNTP